MSAHKYLVHFADQLWLPLLRPSSPTPIQAQELLSRTLSRLELCTFFLGDGEESTIKIRLLSKVVSKWVVSAECWGWQWCRYVVIVGPIAPVRAHAGLIPYNAQVSAPIITIQSPVAASFYKRPCHPSCSTTTTTTSANQQFRRAVIHFLPPKQTRKMPSSNIFMSKPKNLRPKVLQINTM